MTDEENFVVVIENHSEAMKQVRKVLDSCQKRGEDAETIGEEIRHVFYPINDTSIQGLLLAQFLTQMDPHKVGEYFLDTVEREGEVS